jgi:alkanesulfonate monooxygenase SsuD/methylene tetrahydromethanopterin reductase-like flavin-dependent oxidoreductase (luciferase family)
MLRLAAQEADGAIINWFSASDAGKAADIVRRDRPDHELVARILVAPTEDIEAVRALVRRLITAYLTVPAYAASQRWLGRGAALAPMWEAWDGGDRTAALALVPDSVVDELVVHGSPQACRRGIQAYVDNGVTTPVVAILPLGAGIDGALADLVPVP